MRTGGFVFTSNVDGHFQRAGFDPERIVEVHGSFDGMQCIDACGIGIFSGDAFKVEINTETMRASCPIARLPKLWRSRAAEYLYVRRLGLGSFADGLPVAPPHLVDRFARRARLVIVECGAGVAVPIGSQREP